MNKKKHARHAAIDPVRLLADLQSADEVVRAKAVGSLCPCRAGWEMFEQHMEIVDCLKKDPSQRVRTRALHIFEDAGEMQSETYLTHRREVVDEMLRKKRRSRFPPDVANVSSWRI
jgi:hypothetical protein